MAALARLRQLIDDERIDCQLTEADAFTCAATDEGIGAIEREAEAAAAAGLPVDITSSTELGALVKRAVRLPAQAHFDPYAFCNGLVDRLRARNVTVLEHRRVTEVTETADECIVAGADFRIRCDAAVLTTHLPIVDPALIAGRMRPERSYAVAGPTGSDLPTGMYIAHDAGWSLRPALSPAGPMLIVGGEGHSMTDHVSSQHHYHALEALAGDTLRCRRRVSLVSVRLRHHRPPALHRPTQPQQPPPIRGDRIPQVGNDHQHARRHDHQRPDLGHPQPVRVDVRLHTNAARRQPRPDLQHRPRRRALDRRPTQGRQYSRSSRNRELAVGEGRIENRRGIAVAVARADDGRLHTLKAACTHLGCIVGFNDAEQTWDCPCHGSRFTIDGQVLDGPAVKPLERLDGDSSR